MQVIALPSHPQGREHLTTETVTLGQGWESDDNVEGDANPRKQTQQKWGGGQCQEFQLWGNSLKPLSDASYPLLWQPLPPIEKSGICPE